MKRPTISDAQVIIEITKLLGEGFTGKTSNWEQMRTRFKLGKSRHIRLFDEAHSEWAKTTREAQQQVIGKDAQEDLLKAIATEDELDAVLSQIAFGNLEVEEWIKGEPVLRGVSPMEQIAAADKLYKRKGSYAPTKLANTDSEGNDIKHPQMDDKQFNELLNKLNAPSTG